MARSSRPGIHWPREVKARQGWPVDGCTQPNEILLCFKPAHPEIRFIFSRHAFSAPQSCVPDYDDTITFMMCSC